MSERYLRHSAHESLVAPFLRFFWDPSPGGSVSTRFVEVGDDMMEVIKKRAVQS